MPIYIGTSQVNRKEIIIDGKQMQKVYIGNKLVWTKPTGIITVKYGLLFNWYAATDSRNICSVGWHVPTDAEYTTLTTYLGGLSAAGGKLKETGIIYWNSPNTGATNEVGFNARGSGYRNVSSGDSFFTGIRNYLFLWTATALDSIESFYRRVDSSNSSVIRSYGNKSVGFSIRPMKDSTTLTHGQTGTYTDPSGYVYRTICIGTQEWVADNIKTKHYRNGDPIPEVTDNTAWAALTTGAMCAYNNDWANV